jgi:acetyltransferase-like isoleucine patch superfamily enzyme
MPQTGDVDGKHAGRGMITQLALVLGNFRSNLRQALLRSRLRRKNKIDRGVRIFKDVVFHGNAWIGENAILESEVVLSKNVRVGPYARLSRIKVGENSSVDYGVLCTGFGKGKIRIGKETYIGIRNVLDWSDDIAIGDFVHIAGPGTALWTHSTAKMCLNGIPLTRKDEGKFRPTAPITIENNVYIGGNCTIYPGVTVHHHAVVAPNSAVTRDVPSYSMYGGVPALMIKKIPPEDCSGR